MGDQRDFKKFLEAREKAAQSYTTGHAEALVSLCTKESPATFYGPGGGAVVGAHEVSARYEKDALAFKAGGETHFEVLQSAADDGVGFWTGFQHAKVRMGDNPELVTMKRDRGLSPRGLGLEAGASPRRPHGRCSVAAQEVAAFTNGPRARFMGLRASRATSVTSRKPWSRQGDVILTETTARSVVVLYLRQVLDLQRGDAMSPGNQGEPSLIERRRARRARLATAHGAFLVATGLWPLVSLETFEAVSGRKDEPWLVKTVGLVLATLGVVLWQSRREESRAQIELGRLPALALAGIDLWYAGVRRCISPVYLADGVVEIGLAVAWTMVARGDAAPSQAPDGAVLS